MQNKNRSCSQPMVDTQYRDISFFEGVTIQVRQPYSLGWQINLVKLNIVHYMTHCTVNQLYFNKIEKINRRYTDALPSEPPGKSCDLEMPWVKSSQHMSHCAWFSLSQPVQVSLRKHWAQQGLSSVSQNLYT